MARLNAPPELLRSWHRCWAGIGAAGPGDAVQRDLMQAYREPQRKYHTLQHLQECLSLFEANQDLAARPAEVEVALWFHDAIYDLTSADNEARSAAWARDAVSAGGASSAAAERIHALVMATRHTALPSEPDEQLLVDIDLAILGAPNDRFAQYGAQIRQEYAFVQEDVFRQKRTQILKTFLDRNQIFGTQRLRNELEGQARRNLARAIDTLGTRLP